MIDPTRSERTRRWLKAVAARHAKSWSVAVLHPLLDGRTRLETSRDVLDLEDGIVVACKPKDDPRRDVRALVGTRCVGWVTKQGEISREPLLGARVLLHRNAAGAPTTLALTAPMQSLAPSEAHDLFEDPDAISPSRRHTSFTLRSAYAPKHTNEEVTRNEVGLRRAG